MTTDEYMCGACGYIATSPTVMVQHYRAAHAETGVVPPAVANIGGITPAERARLAALLAQATPGPWRHDRVRSMGGAPVLVGETPRRAGQTREVARVLYHGGSEDPEVRANADLIVAAVTALPALLAACDAAEARARDAYRRGQERMREAAIDAVDRFITDMPRRGNEMLMRASDAIAALPITDAEEVDRGA